MKKQCGFSLIELLIILAIVAVIAAITVPSLLQARMAANEAGAIQGCRTIGSAQIAFWALNSHYAQLPDLSKGSFLDSQFTDQRGLNGYLYQDDMVNKVTCAESGCDDFGVVAVPIKADDTGRFKYGISTDQVVRYKGAAGRSSDLLCGEIACADDDPIGITKHRQ
jgi:prepilin-type N-terminal cleavage/methylation domain-containing protein